MSAEIKLRIFNAALGYLGERRLATLNENREPKRVLDDYYSGVVAHCLEMGNWVFATRRARIDAANQPPEFGFRKRVVKPTDWVRTIALSESETLEPPLLRFTEENAWWYVDCDPLYVSYVSNHTNFGLDLSAWPQLFEDYVVLRLAFLACQRISGAESKAESLRRMERKALAAAREHNTNAVAAAVHAGRHLGAVAHWRRRRLALGPEVVLMGKGNFPLYAFNRGEVSRFALGRTDIDRLRLSAEEQVNWQPTVLGPMTIRPGMKYIGATRDGANQRALFIPFVFGNSDTAAIELTGDPGNPDPRYRGKMRI